MSNYLTKEEIRQWRSSLEKITLEEFAARLGKEVEEKKNTNDLIDIVMSKGAASTRVNNTASNDFSKIAERAFKRERQISHTPFSINKKDLVEQQNKIKSDSSVEKFGNPNSVTLNKNISVKEASIKDKVEEIITKKDCQIILKKSLTDREQLVFDYFMNNIGKTVYAKDLAVLLNLPRDYVYKYIKNLRAKIEGDRLKNVASGGYMLVE